MTRGAPQEVIDFLIDVCGKAHQEDCQLTIQTLSNMSPKGKAYANRIRCTGEVAPIPPDPDKRPGLTEGPDGENITLTTHVPNFYSILLVSVGSLATRTA